MLLFWLEKLPYATNTVAVRMEIITSFIGSEISQRQDQHDRVEEDPAFGNQRTLLSWEGPWAGPANKHHA
jgi:hypothetical protein